jgi:signal transduction histidine kinase
LARRIQALLAEAEVDVDAVRAAYMPIPEFFRRDGRRVGRMLAVAAHLPDGRWLTIRAPVADPVGRVQAQLIGQTLILFVLLMLPLLWIARRAAKPLAVLTKAARDAAPGQMPVIAETGPADVRDITRAFNDLSARVRAMLVDKDRTLGAIGHDLRTPLASLRVRIERIDDVPLREAMSATIDEMASMLDDIVALARAGQPHELPVMTDLAALLAGLVDDYVEMGKPVRLAESGIVASALVRPAAIRRALRNLIDNALTYGGDAELGLERQAEWLCLSVSDRGPGVPEARLAEMLEPFTRAEESRNRATGGAGLGLALAKAIAEGEGGTLSLRNRPGGGLVAIIALIA